MTVMTMAAGDDTALGDNTEFRGYSDYKSVSKDVSTAVADAIDIYANLEGYHRQTRGQNPHSRNDALPALAHTHILGAALRLVPELRANKSTREKYQNMLDRWEGTEDEEGYIKQLSDSDLGSNCPDWLRDFVLDIREAAFHLGYLQAGKNVQAGEGDPIEEDVGAMFEGLEL